ncbi:MULTISPECIES: hypothetical protein [Providencia]|jgi:hypothetical protein|uniref:hypothetical protein n=1 Tax=Providencia TaxID=586 RepID=UPI00236145AD|nr:hypothetical protein [Providencia rettgeri]ELR5151175.1 hypothetical protein [Providencia rettgeri]MDR2225860.1 hypothetical protein [Providencia sp.]
MFKKAIFIIFLSFTSCGFASDFTFKEKSPVDRQFDKDYQGVKKLQAEQKFVFDPKKKLSPEEQSYQALLEQRDADENALFRHFNVCDVNPTGAGCPNSTPWMNDRQQMKKMLEQAQRYN